MSRRKSLGTGVKFGQHLLLRHVHSNRLLSLTHLEAADTPGAFKVLLSNPKEAVTADISLYPINKLQKPGEPVRYQDKLQVQLHFGGIKYNLNCARLAREFEVHGSHHVTPWVFEKYDEYTPDTESLRTESPFLIQLKRFSLHVTPKIGRKEHSVVSPPRNFEANVEDPADAFLITDKDDYGGYWVAEKSRPLRGGPILFNETVYLRNLKSGLYLVEDLKLEPKPDPSFTFTFPKPDSFIGSSEIPFNYPVLLKVSGNRLLSPDKSAQREEIMSKIVPSGNRGSQMEEIIVETNLLLQDTTTEENLDALFELIPISQVASQFMMQISKLVPKFETFGENVFYRRDALAADTPLPKWDFHNDIGDIIEALSGSLAILKSGHQPDTYEELQSIVVGLEMHRVLLKIAKALFDTHRKSAEALEQDPIYKEHSLLLFKKIWSFLLEIVADNYYASFQMEKHKLEICEMVVLEKQLIGSLLTEVYRLVDPDMPDYELEFKKWCDRLEPVTAENIQEQTVFIRLIRCLCEVGENVKLEYQRVCVKNLFHEDGFPMVKLMTVKDFCYVHFWQKNQSLDLFLKANPALKPDPDLLSQTGKAFMKLESLMTDTLYVEYLYTALALINTLSMGKNVEGKKYAREELGLESVVVMGMIRKVGVPLKIKEACLLLIDTLVVSCIPYRSSTETRGMDLCFSRDDVMNSGRDENYDNPVDFGDGQQQDIRFCLKTTLSLLLSKELPAELKKSDPRELLEFVKALLQLCYSLIDYEHCSGLYVRSVNKALAFFLVGLSDDTSRKLEKEHWAVAPLKKIVLESEQNMVLRVQLNDLLKLLVELLTLINRFLMRTKVLNIIRICMTENEENPNVAELIDLRADEKILRKMLQPRGDGPADGLTRSTTALMAQVFNRNILLRGPSTKEYLFRVLLNWTAISSGMKESLIALIKQLFAESLQTRRILRNVDIISSADFIETKERLQKLKEATDFSKLLIDAKYELHNMIDWTALRMLNSVLETVTTILARHTNRTNDQQFKLQNIVRHLGFHQYFMQLWNIVMVATRLHRNELPAMKTLRVLLTVFLLNFVRDNEKNRKTIRRLFQPHFYFMTVPQFSELIRELTDFEPLGTADTTRFFAYVLDSFHDHNLGAFNYIKMAIVNRNGALKPEKQNIAARLVAERFNQHSDGKPRLRAELIEILALASIDNGPIIAQCRQLIPPSELERMFNSTEESEVHHALLQYLRYVYLRSQPEMQEYTDEARVLRMLNNSLNLLKPILTGSLSFYNSAAKGYYEQVFPKDNPLKVEKKRVKGSCNDVSNLMHLLSSGNRWSVPGGFLSEVPAILHGIGIQSEPVARFMTSLKSTLFKFSERLLEEQNAHQELDYQLLITSLHKSLEALDSLAASQERSLSGIAKVVASLVKSKANILDPEEDFDKLFLRQRKSVEKQLKRQGEEFYEGLANTFNSVAFRTEAPVTKLPREELNRMVKMLRRIKRLFAETNHRNMYYAFMEALVPEDPLRKLVMNNIFMGAEVLDEAVESLIKHDDYLEVNAALGFLGELLDGQPKEFQDRFQELIDRGEKSYYLFFRIKRELDSAKQGLLEQAIQSSKRGLNLNAFATFTEEEEDDSLDTSERQQYVVRALTFLQLCCDNCNLDFQNYIRTQQKEEGRADVDLVTEVALFVVDLREKVSFVVENKAASKMVVKAIAALLDFVTGPCFDNQVLLGNNVQVYLAINSLLEATQSDLSPRASRIHNKAIIFLHTLLEGEPDPSIYQTMVRFLDLTLMRQGIETFHERYVKGREADFAQELSTIDPREKEKLKTNILQAIFLIKLQKSHPTHPELKKFVQATMDLTHAITFYLSYIGYVEVEKNQVIYEHYFSVPFKCKFLTTASREALIMEVNRQSHQKKIEDFMSKVDVFMREMSHQQKLCSYPMLKKFTTRWQMFAKISFLFVLAINMQLLFSFSGSLEASIHDHPWNMVVITVLGVMQLLTYMISFAFSLLEYFPNMFIGGGSFVGCEISEYNGFRHNESRYLKDVFHSLKQAKVDEVSFASSLREMRNNMALYYNYFYFLVSIVALYIPLFNPVLLLDLIKQNQELVNVLKSITVNARQLILTLCLGMIIVFLFSIYSFVKFQIYYEAENGLYCHDLLNCFTSSLNIGIRAGGIGGEGNIMAADYWARMLYDLLFYLIIIIILLNIIFGIIIDTFAQLRDAKTAVLLDINNVCYVCGQERSLIEQLGKGWTFHFMCEHSPSAYLAFLIYIKEMPIVDCAGIEKYVKERLEKRDSVFMPTSSKLLRLRESGVREEDD